MEYKQDMFDGDEYVCPKCGITIRVHLDVDFDTY